MQIVQLTQGTPEWHVHRRNHLNASDAPAMLNESPYKTRAQLLKEYALGITEYPLAHLIQHGAKLRLVFNPHLAATGEKEIIAAVN